MWEDKTDNFTEKERHYKDTYLEISEVLDNTIEASLFSSETGDYEIYVCYGKMVGIVYANADEAESLRQQMKKDLEEEYKKSKEVPSSDFVNYFGNKYRLDLPTDLFFDMGDFFPF